MFLPRLFSGAAALLRRAASVLDGDNTGVISGTNQTDAALDAAADDAVPAQDPVTPEALAVLSGECPHGMAALRTAGCAACAYEARHGLGAQSPAPPGHAIPAAEFFDGLGPEFEPRGRVRRFSP